MSWGMSTIVAEDSRQESDFGENTNITSTEQDYFETLHEKSNNMSTDDIETSITNAINFRNIHICVGKCLVNKIDDMNELTSVQFIIICEWSEPTLIDTDNTINRYFICNKEKLPWTPSFVFYNLADINTTEETYYFNATTGSACLVLNNIILFNECFRLDRYPFDRQKLNIIFSALNTGMCYEYTKDVGCPAAIGFLIGNGLKAGVRSTAWLLHTAEMSVDPTNDPYEPECIVTYTLLCERVPLFYVVNFGLVIYLLLCTSMTVFSIDPEDIASRLSVTVTVFLTIVAFKFVIASYVPPTPYLTLLDQYMLIAIALLFAIIVENYVAKVSDDAKGDNDYLFCQVIFLAWSVFHLFIFVASYLEWFRASWESVSSFNLLKEVTKEGRYVNMGQKSIVVPVPVPVPVPVEPQLNGRTKSKSQPLQQRVTDLSTIAVETSDSL